MGHIKEEKRGEQRKMTRVAWRKRGGEERERPSVRVERKRGERREHFNF